MKAVYIDSFSEALKNLKTHTIPDQAPHDGEAKVKILAASVNPSDVKNVQGKIARTKLPRIPGRDFAGVVVEGPREVVGKEVWGSGGDVGFTRDGTHAEFLVVPADALVPKPRNLSFEQAACAGVNFVTAYIGLINRAKVQRGETLLVTGAGGGVGLAVLQLGQIHNARLIAVDRKPLQSATFEGLELSGYVDTSKDKLREAVHEITKGAGVNVAYDCVGGELFEPVLSTLGRLGRQVEITSAGTRRVSFDLLEFYHRQLTLFGVDSIALTVTESSRLLAAMTPDFEAGRLRPSAISKRGTLDEAFDLYKFVENGGRGKAVFSLEGAKSQ
jgi:NADPH:quinone reductase